MTGWLLEELRGALKMGLPLILLAGSLMSPIQQKERAIPMMRAPDICCIHLHVGLV